MSLLDKRRKELGIPEIPYLPIAKNVLIYRLPEEERTAGGLYVPESNREPHSKGVLLAAGLGALDILYAHLVEIGDVVWFGRFAGWEKEVERGATEKGAKILQAKVEDVLGSVDAIARAREYRIVLDADEGEHSYERKAA